MLQQTQVDTVIPFYHRFLERFPTVHDLSAADLHDVLKQWENMGYYTRARNLHRAAIIISRDYRGRFPHTWETLIALPGIGLYTAGALLSIAFGKPVPAVDGNVRRILCRLLAIADPPSLPKTQVYLHETASQLLPHHDPGGFNQALMDLGALICRPGIPQCSSCPVRLYCRAYEQGLTQSLPVKTVKRRVPHRTAVVAIIVNKHGEILAVQRPNAGLLGALWKFPGGFAIPAEPLEEALIRTVRNELGIDIRVGNSITAIDHAYTHFRLTLHVFQGIHEKGRPENLQCQDWRWITKEEMKKIPFSKAEHKVMQALKDIMP